MKFETWLRKQKHRDDRIGDVARDFIDSRTATIIKSFEKYSPCEAAKEAYREACEEYLEFLKKLLDLFPEQEEGQDE